jgi:hypothetical protein
VPLVTLTVRQPKSAEFKAGVCFKETSWENWSFGGGRLIHT